MVENQLRANRVTDERIVDAFASIPRELFAPEHLRRAAYADEDLPLGDKRWLMEPRVLGRLLSAAQIGPGDAALDVCSASGYATAVLGWLAAFVVGVEDDAELVQKAGRNLEQLELSNALVLEGDPRAGAPSHAPYDVILVSGGVAEAPRAVLEQLAEGGRLVAVERGGAEAGQGASQGAGVLYERHGARFPKRVLFDAQVPLLPEFAPEPGFVF